MALRIRPFANSLTIPLPANGDEEETGESSFVTTFRAGPRSVVVVGEERMHFQLESNRYSRRYWQQQNVLSPVYLIGRLLDKVKHP
jgi:hypothetical protein